MAFFRAPIRITKAISWVDAFLFIGLIFALYALLGVVQDWVSPYRPVVEIKLDFFSLFKYSFYSLVRVTTAYLLSLVFTFTYGYWAAKSKRAEPILISLLDILQSIPVLGFMPIFVLALIRLFPHSNLGLEFAAIIMIFTGEGWNMVFSFYSSVKAVPSELRDVSSLFRMKKVDVFRKIELPYAMNGLLWNSMLSMAGGWFFLMTIESFKLGDQSFQLPGIGSYMAVAYEKQDGSAIFAGIFAMFVLIVLVDRCVWAPLVVWSERFRSETDASHRVGQHSVVLDLLRKSDLLEKYFEWESKFAKKMEKRQEKGKSRKKKTVRPEGWVQIFLGLKWLAIVVGVVAVVMGGKSMTSILSQTTVSIWLGLLRDVICTFLRVICVVIVGSFWTVPLGVFIGTKPKWTNRLQPVVQVVASFPAPMLFPMIIWILSRMGIGFEIGATVLMLFASQWYILFNVISGATLIPREMIELGLLFRVKGLEQWKAIIIPAVFPSLVNGWITAAGGAWNASIVAEYIKIGPNTLVATGIGATITKAADQGSFPLLAAGVLLMVTIVVLINRLFWNNLYRLAETKYRLE